MYLSLLAALMLTGASVCLAQSVPKSETNNAVPVAACDREWAQKLIAQQVDEARKLSDPGMRISVLAITSGPAMDI
jgi:hypothetical protein